MDEWLYGWRVGREGSDTNTGDGQFFVAFMFAQVADLWRLLAGGGGGSSSSSSSSSKGGRTGADKIENKTYCRYRWCILCPPPPTNWPHLLRLKLS